MLNIDSGIRAGAWSCGNIVGEIPVSGHDEDPVWKKNTCKIYVVVYPSDATSTYFQADPSAPKVDSTGAGYGIFVEPKRVSKAKFWKEKDGEPTLYTVEGGGPAPGVTVRRGVQWGINGMLVRFLIDSQDDPGKVVKVHEVLERIARQMNIKRGDASWLREAMIALMEAALVRQFHVQEFIELAGDVVKHQVQKGASRDRVATLYYEDHIIESSGIGSRK